MKTHSEQQIAQTYMCCNAVLLMVQIVFVLVQLFLNRYKIIDPVQNLLKWFHCIFLRNSFSLQIFRVRVWGQAFILLIRVTHSFH